MRLFKSELRRANNENSCKLRITHVHMFQSASTNNAVSLSLANSATPVSSTFSLNQVKPSCVTTVKKY